MALFYPPFSPGPVECGDALLERLRFGNGFQASLGDWTIKKASVHKNVPILHDNSKHIIIYSYIIHIYIYYYYYYYYYLYYIILYMCVCVYVYYWSIQMKSP